MSQLLGIINLKNKDLEETDYIRMYNSVSAMPHEKHNYIIKQEFAIGHLLTYNTPEAIYEKGICKTDDNIYFVFCGRIDNRDDLCKELKIKNNSKIPDGNIALETYKKWGEECVEKIYGDWHFVTYNTSTKKAFFARDHFGYTSLFYYKNNEVILFASSSTAITDSPFYKKELNKTAFLSQLLLLRGNPHKEKQESFFYKKLHNIPFGHTLTYKKNNITLNRYWFPENTVAQKSKTIDQYANELYSLFEDAVRCRLRSYLPVASMLSGGLDSSSVVTVASNLLSKKDEQLTTFSHIPLYEKEIELYQKKNNRTLNEKENIIAVTKNKNINTLLLNSKEISPSEGIKKAIKVYNSCFHGAANAYWMIDIFTQTKKKNFGTLLTGEMGNLTISLNPPLETLSFNHIYFLKKPLKLIRNKLIKLIVVNYFLNTYSKISKKMLSSKEYIKNSYLLNFQFKKNNLLINENSFKLKKLIIYNSNKKVFLNYFLSKTSVRLALGAQVNHYFGFEQRDPTGDPRIIEYIYSLPSNIFVNDKGERKYLIKKMMKNKLPDKVLFSRKKGLQSSDITYKLISDKKQITQSIIDLSKNPEVTNLFDTDKMLNDLNKITNSKDHFNHSETANILLKNIMFTQFLDSKF